MRSYSRLGDILRRNFLSYHGFYLKKKHRIYRLHQADEWLTPVMTVEEKNKFLEPLNILLNDTRILTQMKGNIGIFCKKNSFNVLSIPIKVERTCQVATSFHVKPLLKWLQSEQEFLLLGIEKEVVHLYSGNLEKIKLLDSISIPKSFTSSDSNKEKMIQEEVSIAWINRCISQHAKILRPKLFLAGEKALVRKMTSGIKYKNIVKTPVAQFFSPSNINHISLITRERIKAQSRAKLEKSLQEFRLAQEDKRTPIGLSQISKAVVQGRVKKLIIADKQNIFGKIDKKSGRLNIHPFDLDHEDDDILDDLAQMVLCQGGEVIVASHHEIPKGRPIAAILNTLVRENEKKKYTETLKEISR